MAVGAAKQFGLMYWCDPSPEVGLQVRIGFSCISLVPRSDWLLTLNVVPGILRLLRFMPKFCPLRPVRLAPLSICVMPDSCQPLTKPPAILFPFKGLPN